MTRKNTTYLLVGLGLLLAVAGVIQGVALMHRAPAGIRQQIASGQQIRSGKMIWRVQDITWREFDGGYSAQATFVPLRGSKMGIGEAMVAMCGAFLTDLPQRPNPSVKRSDVYRLDIQVEGSTKPLWGKVFPVRVVHGACQAKTHQIFWNFGYGGDLKNWLVGSFFILPKEYPDTLNIDFEWAGTGRAPLYSFDFATGCAAVLADPPQPVRDMVEIANLKWITVNAVDIMNSDGGPMKKAVSRSFVVTAAGDCVLEQAGGAL